MRQYRCTWGGYAKQPPIGLSAVTILGIPVVVMPKRHSERVQAEAKIRTKVPGTTCAGREMDTKHKNYCSVSGTEKEAAHAVQPWSTDMPAGHPARGAHTPVLENRTATNRTLIFAHLLFFAPQETEVLSCENRL